MIWAMSFGKLPYVLRTFWVEHRQWDQEFRCDQALSQLKAVEPHELILRAKVRWNMLELESAAHCDQR